MMNVKEIESAAPMARQAPRAPIHPGAMPRPRIAFVVNGPPQSAMGERAKAFAERLNASFDIELVFREGRRGAAFLSMLRRLHRIRPRLCCVFDLGIDGFTAAFLYGKAARAPFII